MSPPGAWAEQLARLEAPLGIYAILGNHDWWSAAMPTDPPDDGAQHPQDAGRRRHSAARKRRRRTQPEAGGRSGWSALAINSPIGSPGARPAGIDDLHGALRQIRDDAPAILLAHEPFVFPKSARPCRAHSMRSYPWRTGPAADHRRAIRPVDACGVKPYIYGLYAEGQRRLIVSGGLGTSHLPVRLMCPPEVVCVTLTGAQSA